MAEQRALDAEANAREIQARVAAAENELQTLRAAAAKLGSEKQAAVSEASGALAAAVEARTKIEAELTAAKSSFAKKV